MSAFTIPRIAFRQLLLWSGLFVTQLALAEGPPAGRSEAPAPAVKAAFLQKFANYVEWPASVLGAPDNPFVIAVMGAEDVAAELDKIVPGTVIHGRTAAVRRLKEGDPIAGVHLLFIGRGQANLRALVRAAQQHGTLVVTDAERGLEAGSAINFVLADERVGFEVSVEAAERSGLNVSSRLLNVARRVVTRP